MAHIILHDEFELFDDLDEIDEDDEDDIGPLNARSGYVVHQYSNESTIQTSTGTGTDHANVDKLLSQKMNTLSIEERTQGIHELHGVADKVQETPEMIQQKLVEMNHLILDNIAQVSAAQAAEVAAVAVAALHSDGDTTTSLTAALDHDIPEEITLAPPPPPPPPDDSSVSKSIDSDTSASTTSTVASSRYSNRVTVPAYQLALQQDPDYVERIKILCLRGRNYDPVRATKNLLDFFAFKLEVFGESKLTKRIKLADLKKEEIEEDNDEDGNREEKDRSYDAISALTNGCFVLLQQRDTTGRAIIMMVGTVTTECSTDAVWKSLYYIVMVALQDQEIQRHGAVFITYSIGQRKFHSDRPAKFAQVLNCLPIRIVAVHACFDKPLGILALKIFCEYMESILSCRLRAHHGSYSEVIYELMTFGIPRHVLPFNEANGQLELDAHHRWLQMQQAKEEAAASISVSSTTSQPPPASTSTTMMKKAPTSKTTTSTEAAVAVSVGNMTTDPTTNEIVTLIDDEEGPRGREDRVVAVVPGPMDILVGRGTASKSSPGYIRMRNLIQDYQEEYEVADRNSKTQLSRTILRELYRHECRFVRWTDQGLVVCDDKESREKISHAFRNMRRTMMKGGANKNRDGVGKKKTKKQQREDEVNKRGRPSTLK